jgi:hypothetical protein
MKDKIKMSLRIVNLSRKVGINREQISSTTTMQQPDTLRSRVQQPTSKNINTTRSLKPHHPNKPNQAAKSTATSATSALSISKSSTIETVDEATKYRPITEFSKALRAST